MDLHKNPLVSSLVFSLTFLYCLVLSHESFPSNLLLFFARTFSVAYDRDKKNNMALG